MVDLINTTCKDFLLMRAQKFDEFLGAVPVDSSCLSDVVIHSWKEILVKLNQVVETAFSDIERCQTWQEIISDKEAEEYEVINDALNIEPEAQLAIQLLVLQHHVLPQQRYVNQLEVVRMGELNTLHSTTRLVSLDDVLLSYDGEVRLVREQT